MAVYGQCQNCDCILIRSLILKRWVHIYPCEHPRHDVAPSLTAR